MFDRINDLFITMPRDSGKSRKSRRMQIEDLEVRQVMAANITANLGADGVLRVEGTQNGDQIHLYNEAGKVRVAGVTMNVAIPIYGGTVAMTEIASSAVKSIEVTALAGIDTIQIQEDLAGSKAPISMTVYGGSGADTIFGGSGADTLMGGNKWNSEETGFAAASLDAKEKFYYAGSEYLNFSGLNEKWFFGQGNQWHYIKPSGEIYRSNGSTPAFKIGKVDPAFYTNLNDLLDADSGPTAAYQDRSLGLYSTGNLYLNSGGKNEKWVMSSTNGK